MYGKSFGWEIGKATAQIKTVVLCTNLHHLVVVDLCKRTCMDIVVACIVLAYELLDIPVVCIDEHDDMKKNKEKKRMLKIIGPKCCIQVVN